MSWFRVDDKFAFHPKAIRAGNEAVGVWVRVGSWSSDQMTDGAIPGDVALVIANGNQSVLDQLVAAGLLVRDGSGYHMHDFLDWNPSAKQVKRQRKADAERKRGIRPPSGKTPTGVRSESSSPIPSPDPIPIPEEEEQTPLPPKGAQVSMLQLADGSGAGGGKKPRGKKPPPAPLPDLARGALEPRELAALEAIEAHPMLLAICKDPCRLARGLAGLAKRIDVVTKIHALAIHAEHKGTYKNGNAFLNGCIGRDEEAAAARGVRPLVPPAEPSTPPRCPPRPKAVEDGIRQIVAEREARAARGEVDTLADSRRRAEAAGALVGFGGMEPAEHESEMFS